MELKIKLENLFKHRCPFNFVKEEFYETTTGLLEDKVIRHYKEFETIKIKTEKSRTELLDDILPFLSYLQSLKEMEKTPNFKHTNIFINLLFHEKISARYEHLIVVFSEIGYDCSFNDIYDIFGYVPKEYFKIK